MKLQLVQGIPPSASQRILRALQLEHAAGALFFFSGTLGSSVLCAGMAQGAAWWGDGNNVSIFFAARGEWVAMTRGMRTAESSKSPRSCAKTG